MTSVGRFTPKTIIACAVLWGALAVSAGAWEPGAAGVDAAVKSGDFQGTLIAATAYLNTKLTSAGSAASTEPGLVSLLKDPQFILALDQRRLIAKVGADHLKSFASEPANREFLTWFLNDAKAMDLYLEGGAPREKDSIGSLAVWRRIFSDDPASHSGMLLRVPPPKIDEPLPSAADPE